MLFLSRLLIAICAMLYAQDFLTINEIADELSKWDAGWYIQIARNGYETYPLLDGSAMPYVSWAFFPLYPLLLSLVHNLLPMLGYNTAAMLISNIFLVVALIYIALYLENINKKSIILVVYFLMIFGAYNFYYSIAYTESLFVMLIAMSLYYTDRKQWIIAGACCGLLSMTKTVGVLFFFCILYEMYSETCKYKKNIVQATLKIMQDGKKILSLFLCPLGLFIYMMYLYMHTGDAFGFSHAQKTWGRKSELPFTVIYNGLSSGDIFTILITLVCILGLIGVIYFAIKKQYKEMIILGFMTVPGLFSGVNSVPRYVVGSLVFFFFISELIVKTNKLKYVCLCISAIVGVVLVFGWLSYSPYLI